MLLICLQFPFVLADLKKILLRRDFYLSCSWVLETGDPSEFGEVDGKVVHVWHRDRNSIHLKEVILSCTVWLDLWLHQLIACITGGISDMFFCLGCPSSFQILPSWMSPEQPAAHPWWDRRAWLHWEQCHHRCLHSWVHVSAGILMPSYFLDKTLSLPMYPSYFQLQASTLSEIIH